MRLSHRDRCEICGQKFLHVADPFVFAGEDEAEKQNQQGLAGYCVDTVKQIAGILLTLCLIVMLSGRQ